MTRLRHKSCLRALIKVAMPAIEVMPPGTRADAYDGIAIVARTVDPDVAAAAGQIAQHLRDAELRQGQFRDLFRDA